MTKYDEYLYGSKYAEHMRYIEHEERMLKGDFNRICVTHDLDEMLRLQKAAKESIDRVLDLNIRRLIESGLYKEEEIRDVTDKLEIEWEIL